MNDFAFLPLHYAVVLCLLGFVVTCNKKVSPGGMVLACGLLAFGMVFASSKETLLVGVEAGISLFFGSVVGFYISKRFFPEEGINPADFNRLG